MENSSLTFAYPWYLVFGLFAVVGTLLLIRALRKRNYRALEAFASQNLLPRLLLGVSRRRRIFKAALLASAAFLIFAAIARPQKGFQWEEQTRKGIDILFALDTSKSMLAADVKPNRLERSKLALMDFISKLEGDRVGLITFSGTSFLMVPLTLDYEAFLESLQSVDTNLIPRPGTNIASSIEEAIRALKTSPNEKILVLISDGEDLEEGTLASSRAAAEAGLKIFSIGVGSPDGEIILLKNDSGGSSFLKDRNGNAVKSRLDEKTLSEIAQISNGAYFRLGQFGEGLDQVSSERLKLLPKQNLSQRMKRIPIDRFEWCLLAALVLLMAEFGIKDRPSNAPSVNFKNFLSRFFGRVAKRSPDLPKRLLLCLCALALTSCSKSPEELYNDGLYSDASQKLGQLIVKDQDNPVLHYNLGTSKYKEGKFEEAEEELGKALETSNLNLQEQAYYNMGNALYRKGEKSLGNDKANTIENWKAALSNYEGALKLNEKNEDARFNYDFVERKLNELLEKQKQETQEKISGQDQEPQNQPQNQSQSEQEKQDEQNKDPAMKNDENNESKTSKSDKVELDNKKMQPTKAEESPTPVPSSSSGQVRQDATEMSQEEAQALLEALRNEEKRNVIQPKDLHNFDERPVDKNW